MFDTVAIGSTTRDAFYEIGLQSIRWPKTESGRAYVLPCGEKLEVRKIYFTIGGNAANASVTFARQGFRTAVAAKVGEDVAGEEIRRRLQRESVDVGMIASDSALPTAYSVLIMEKGERTILGYHGASDSFSLKDVAWSGMKSRWWYLSLAGESDAMYGGLLRFAKRNSVAVAFNPSGHHLHHKRKRHEILASLPYITFLVLNEEEAALLAGVSFRNERAVFKKLDAFMPGILAVTDGRNGVTVSDGKFVYKAGIFKERKLVDRTGAGDAFGSGFVAGLMRRGVTARNVACVRPDDVIYAIRCATANATAVVETLGATEGILTRREFESAPRFRTLSLKKYAL